MTRGKMASLSLDMTVHQRVNNKILVLQPSSLEVANNNAIHFVKRDLEKTCERMPKLEEGNVGEGILKVYID